MLMPDVNVLVYAHRQDEASHAAASRWVDAAFNGVEPFALSTLVAVAFVRIVTNARIFRTSTPSPVALASIDAIVARANCRFVSPGPRHWLLVSELCRAHEATGKLVADAQHAAVALEHGCEWVSFDRDFERFASDGLRWTLLAQSD